MRAGVAQTTAAEALGALPVPTACPAGELNLDHGNTSEDTGCENFTDALCVRCKVRLLEDTEHDVVFGSCVDHCLTVVGMHSKRLFGDDIEAVLQKIECNGIVLIGVGRVDDKVNVFSVENFMIIGEDLTAKACLCLFTAEIKLVDDSDDFVLVIVCGCKELGMNVLTGTTVADDGNS